MTRIGVTLVSRFPETHHIVAPLVFLPRLWKKHFYREADRRTGCTPVDHLTCRRETIFYLAKPNENALRRSEVGRGLSKRISHPITRFGITVKYPPRYPDRDVIESSLPHSWTKIIYNSIMSCTAQLGLLAARSKERRGPI